MDHALGFYNGGMGLDSGYFKSEIGLKWTFRVDTTWMIDSKVKVKTLPS
jgi:hypothetical protein